MMSFSDFIVRKQLQSEVIKWNEQNRMDYSFQKGIIPTDYS